MGLRTAIGTGLSHLIHESGGSLLVEALVGVAILAVALIPIIGGFGLSPAALDGAGRQSVALNIARGRLESVHALTAAQWDALLSQPAAPDPLQPEYEVAQTVAVRPDLVGLKDVTVSVTWTGIGDGRVDLTTAVARRP